MIDLKLLIKNGVHFGHQSWRRNPKMEPYIWGEKNGVSLINVDVTARKLDSACAFLEQVAASGRPVLWVGTKKAAKTAIQKAAEATVSPSVTHRWIGGVLTNYGQVKKSVTKMMHFEDIIAKAGEQHTYTKKEYGMFKKMADRLHKNVGGIRSLNWPVAALVVVDVRKEHVAVKEAQAMGIPVVALVDTNCDPSGIDYIIPANDDVPRAISVLVDELAEAVKRGKAQAKAEDVAQDSQELVDILIADVHDDADEDTKEAKKESVRAKKAAVKEAGESKPKAQRRPVQRRTVSTKTAPVTMAPRTPRPVGDRPARPAGDRPTGDRPARPAGDRPARSFGDRPSRPAGDRPARPAGDRPARPAGDRPARSFGDRPSRPAGDRPARPAGDRPARPAGDRPARSFGDRPSRPAGDRPARPAGDRPARPAGDRPARPASEADKKSE